MLRRGLKTELRTLAITTAGVLLLGILTDSVTTCLVGGLLCYIAWLLFRLKELENWVARTRRGKNPPEDFSGVCAEICDDIRLLGRRHEKDKLRLQAVVARVQQMTSALSDGVILLDSRANIEWWNNAAQDYFNFQKVDYGHKLINIFRNPRFISYFEEQDYDQPLELLSVWRENQHLEFNIHPFGEGERLVVVRDVTRVKRLEQMRKDFVSNVSHELRTPLTVIKGYIETLADSPDTKPTWQNALKHMHSQSDRMNALVHDLITLSKLETDDTKTKPDTINMQGLIDAIIQDANALASETIGEQDKPFTISYKGPQFKLLGKEQELRSALSNLVFNAVKYSPSGGTITISTEFTRHECIIHVSDQGLGIDQKHIHRITERFYRVDEGRSTSMGGTGLGLAIVKHVLMRHQADLKIRSTIGQGSTFSCHFPISRVVDKQVA